MPEVSNPQSILAAMIVPAVLISACGTLIVSTSMRLARIVDRVRGLSQNIEELSADEATVDFIEDRVAEFERQLTIHTRRGQLIQRSLTSLYLSLGLFVAATVALALVSLLNRWEWLPLVLGIAGTVILFYSSVLLIAETRLALRSVNYEMAFAMKLRAKYQERRRAAAGLMNEAAPVVTQTSSLGKISKNSESANSTL
jgi:Protein of unknown function (DUF2721)